MTWEALLEDLRGQSWRVLLDPPASGPDNMRRDLELLGTSSGPVARFYSWIRPTVSLGYSQSEDWVGGALPVVRRPSGGRALLHDQEITYALILPGVATLRVDEVYCGITACLRQALQALGVPVECATTLQKSASPGCMATIRPGELVSPLGKLVGCAQLRRGDRLLHHGVISLRVDNRRLQRAIPGHPPLHGLDELGCQLEAGDLARELGKILGYAPQGGTGDGSKLGI